MLFKCPICKREHSVQNNYDNMDFECPNVSGKQKTFQDLVPTNQLSRNGFNMNRSSTLIDEARPVTIIGIRPNFRPTGERFGQLKKNY